MSAVVVGINLAKLPVIALCVPALLKETTKFVAIVPSTLTDPAAVIVESELSADDIAPAVALNPIAPLVWPPKERVNVPDAGAPVRLPTPNFTLVPV
jgi:hypothetical protein